MKRYIDECLQGKEGPRGKDFNMRWIASMVADVHRILSRGGVFMYPWDKREPEKAGKLRLMYEANPMSWLVEQAGGMATNGRQRILDIQFLECGSLEVARTNHALYKSTLLCRDWFCKQLVNSHTYRHAFAVRFQQTHQRLALAAQ
jgi:hypothetical protein